MGDPRDLQLGELAIEKGWTTRAQVEECLRANSDPPKPLGQRLLERGFVTMEQLGELLELQKRRLLEEQQRTRAREVGLFGQLALSRGYVTSVQLDECVHEQGELARKGEKLGLGQILIKKRYLTTDQFLEILKLQEKFLVKCDGCGSKYNAAGFKEGSKIRCKKCGRILVVASRPDTTVHVDESVTPGHAGVTDSSYLHRAGLPTLVGQTFGKYEILQEIGRGGMGIIFKARHRELRTVSALKILKEGEGADERSVQRFHREAKTAARLRHPNIVSVHDVGVERGLHSTKQAISGRKNP